MPGGSPTAGGRAPSEARCPACAAERLLARREDYAFEVGVVLRAAEVLRCGSCEEEFVVVPRLAGLFEAITRFLLQVPRRLFGPEIRHLRKSLGLPIERTARLLGTSAETFALWEDGLLPIPAVSDRALRLFVGEKAGERLTFDTLHATQHTPAHVQDELYLVFEDGAWRVADVEPHRPVA